MRSKCLALSVPVLIAKMSGMEDDKCDLQLQSLVANGSTAPVPANCKDNNDGMLAVAHMSCAQVKAQHVCNLVGMHLLPDLCKCACPPKPKRRKTQGVSYAGGKSCSLTSFDAKLANVNKYCCDPKDPDDKCVNGVPAHWCVTPPYPLQGTAGSPVRVTLRNWIICRWSYPVL